MENKLISEIETLISNSNSEPLDVNLIVYAVMNYIDNPQITTLSVPTYISSVKLIYTQMVKSWPNIVKSLNPDLHTDLKFIKSLLTIQPKCLKYFHIDILDNAEIIKFAVFDLKFVKAFKYASERLHADYELCRELLLAYFDGKIQFKNYLQYITNESIKMDREIFNAHTDVLTYAHKDLKNDETFMKPLIAKNPLLLQYAGKNITSNFDIVEGPVKAYPCLLAFVDPKLWKRFAHLF